MMDPWLGRLATFACTLGYVLIRWPHGKRSGEVKVVKDRRGALDTALLALATLGTTVLPVVWLVSGFPSRADYPLRPWAFRVGVLLMAAGLLLFHRSHRDLGDNWSVTLQVRENHRLVTRGVYARVRHPMYSSMLLLGLGQALYLPNWIAGPSYLVSFLILYLLRVGREEGLMREQFGAEYERYAARTGRLLPPLSRARSQGS